MIKVLIQTARKKTCPQANSFPSSSQPSVKSLAIASFPFFPPSQSPHKSPTTSPRNLLRRSLLPRCIPKERESNNEREEREEKFFSLRCMSPAVCRLRSKIRRNSPPYAAHGTPFQSFQDGRLPLVKVDGAALAVRTGVGEDSELAGGVAIGAGTG